MRQPLLNHLDVLKQSAVVGNTFTGHESSVPEDASVTRLCLTKCFLGWIDQCEHQTRLPLPMTCKRVSVLSESSLINLKCNSKTNTTVTLTKSSVLWVLRGRLELHLQHLDFALDVDWHSSNVEDARWSTRCTWRRCTGWTARFARSYTVLLSLIAVDQYFGALCNTALL